MNYQEIHKAHTYALPGNTLRFELNIQRTIMKQFSLESAVHDTLNGINYERILSKACMSVEVLNEKTF